MITVDFFGDSITAGAGASTAQKCYVGLVNEDPDIKAKNYGISCARFAHQSNNNDGYEPLCFLNRVEGLGKADVLYVFGGTNDYGHGDAKMGKLGDTDTFTFHGAVRTIIEGITKQFPVSKITFILPLPRYNEDDIHGEGLKKTGYPLSEYRKAIIEELNEKGIRYVDFSKEFPRPTSKADVGYFKDGLHPNDNGHALLASLIIKDIKEHYCH